MSTDRTDELIALAALGELTPAEERELDRLLATDPEAASELRATLDVASAVQSAVAETPPPELRERVMASTAQLPQAPADRPDTAGEPQPDTAGEPQPDADREVPGAPNVVGLERHRRRRLASFIGAAAAALVLVVGAAVIVTGDRDGGDPVAAVLDAPDVRELQLAGELGELSVFFSPSENAIVVDGTGVRRPSGSNTFELWLVDGSGAIPVGLFRPDDDGRVEQRFDGVDITGFGLGVTEEPAGGSETPTLPILASA